jgi:hypothetical protein
MVRVHQIFFDRSAKFSDSTEDSEIRRQKDAATVFTYEVDIADTLTKYTLSFRIEGQKTSGWFSSHWHIILPRHGSSVKLE